MWSCDFVNVGDTSYLLQHEDREAGQPEVCLAPRPVLPAAHSFRRRQEPLAGPWTAVADTRARSVFVEIVLHLLEAMEATKALVCWHLALQGKHN